MKTKLYLKNKESEPLALAVLKLRIKAD